MRLISEMPVPDGLLASIVTSLEMTKPHAATAVDRGEFGIELLPCPDLDRYRDLYRRIGSHWLWSWRLAMSAADLAAIVHDGLVEIRMLRRGGLDEGLLELDFRREGECELKLFGVTPDLVGTGAGRWLMNRALEIVWQRPVGRFWVHTCSMDHPRALEFYMRSGFTPFRRHVEIEIDPRLTGLLPQTAAPHVAIIGK